MVGLLEQDICANAGFLQLTVVLYSGGGNIYIHPADISVFVMDAVYSLYAVKYILNRTVHRVLAGLYSQPLVAHILQSNDLGPDLLLSKLLPWDMLVYRVIGAVDTSIHTVI